MNAVAILFIHTHLSLEVMVMMVQRWLFLLSWLAFAFSFTALAPIHPLFLALSPPISSIIPSVFHTDSMLLFLFIRIWLVCPLLNSPLSILGAVKKITTTITASRRRQRWCWWRLSCTNQLTC